MTSDTRVVNVDPRAAIPGGEVTIHLQDVSAEGLKSLEVRFGVAAAHLVSASTSRALALVPEIGASGPVQIMMAGGSGAQPSDAGIEVKLRQRIAGKLHPVT